MDSRQATEHGHKQPTPHVSPGRQSHTFTEEALKFAGTNGRRVSAEPRGRRSTWSGLNAPKNRAAHFLYHRIEISGDDGGSDMRLACEGLVRALACRERFERNMWMPASVEAEDPVHANDLAFAMDDGIVFYEGQDFAPIPYEEYVEDIRTVSEVVESPAGRRACLNRLRILDEKYKMFRALNADLEENHCPFRKGGGVFAKCVKVDNSVRLTTAMHAQYLLEFIVERHRVAPHTIVGRAPDGPGVTLGDVFGKHKITDPQELTVEGIGLHPPAQKRFHRFDIFSEKFNRGGKQSAELLKLFLKRDGPFYADIVRPILDRNDRVFDHDRVATEYKLPIFGLDRQEWCKLASWVFKNNLGSRRSNRWVIQIPRIAELRGLYKCDTLQAQLDNIFLPIWEATVAPTAPENKELARLLLEIGAFNIISDENARGQELPVHRVPKEWKWSENPPDLYFNYYVWANICSLNYLRRKKGLNQFQFRPNCGENGRNVNLTCGFILADGINHGVLLEGSPVLQYLYYLAQVGIVFSPLANNGLDSPKYDLNPFQQFQRMGFRVSLGTDDPLHYHHSPAPCIEEYGTAQKLYRLGPVDLTEVARNSVLISGYTEATKENWLGPGFRDGVQGNDPLKSNVPNVRLLFREDTLCHEQEILSRALEHVQADPSAHSNSLAPPRVQARTSLGQQMSSGNISLSEVEQGISFPRISVVDPAQTHNAEQQGAQAKAAKCLSKCLALRNRYIWKHPKNPWEKYDVLRDGNDVQFESKAENDEDLKNDKGAEYEYKMIGGVIKYRRVDTAGEDPGELTRKGSMSRKDSSMHKSSLLSRSGSGVEGKGDGWLPKIADLKGFKQSFSFLHECIDDIQVKTLCHQRLKVLEHKFNLHLALNSMAETGSTKAGNEQTRDFYQATKVDTHIHAAAGMTARQLLDFIREKAKFNGDDIVKVNKKTGAPETLKEMFLEQGVHPEKLTVDDLNVHADLGRGTMFDRFDKFNASYNPMGSADLRSLLLKTDNWMGGRYFAEILKCSFAQYQRDKYTFAEMRLSIYGRSNQEWKALAEWFDTHGMANAHNKWMVQVPRVYHVFRSMGAIKSFGHMLRNIFEPLWEVSMFPGKHPKLHHLLRHMSGFDSVDNEAIPDSEMPLIDPDEYEKPNNPPYGYWMYHMWANIRALNEFRSRRGMSTFGFRPHCGESGSPDHLVHCYLTADGVNHGINLSSDPVLEYMYYLSQIGIAVSPLSNNSLFLDYLKNPFPEFFRRGLNVSLSTDDPLQFHHTQEPLIEEYSCASKVWKLGPNDMCEIARNSVLQCGFDEAWKASAIGPEYYFSSSRGNCADKTNLSDIRVAYRFETYHSEINHLAHLTSPALFKGLRAKMQVADELQLLRKLEGGSMSDDRAVPPAPEDTSPPRPAQCRVSDIVQQNDQLRDALLDFSRVVSDAERVLGGTESGDAFGTADFGFGNTRSELLPVQGPPAAAGPAYVAQPYSLQDALSNGGTVTSLAALQTNGPELVTPGRPNDEGRALVSPRKGRQPEKRSSLVPPGAEFGRLVSVADFDRTYTSLGSRFPTDVMVGAFGGVDTGPPAGAAPAYQAFMAGTPATPLLYQARLLDAHRQEGDMAREAQRQYQLQMQRVQHAQHQYGLQHLNSATLAQGRAPPMACHQPSPPLDDGGRRAPARRHTMPLARMLTASTEWPQIGPPASSA